MRLLASAGLGALMAVCMLGAAAGPVLATTTFVVNRNGDAADNNLADTKCDTSSASGKQCTLRAAIQESNDTSGPDTINFKIKSSSKVIAPASPLPQINDETTINGYSQAGASPNTLAVGSNAVLKIVLDGINAGVGTNGLQLYGFQAVVKGLVIQRFNGSGVLLPGLKGSVLGCFIGTNAAGTAARANGAGVLVTGSQNWVGGTAPASRNLISGNTTHGVNVTGASASYNTVYGNYIGTNAAGTAALGNGGNGVYVNGGERTAVGVATTGGGNVVSANGQRGISVSGSDNNTVRANRVGTKADGGGDLGNVSDGIFVSQATDNVIGGSASGSGNVVAGNGGSGINFAGIHQSGNEVRGNVVQANDLVGIRAGGGQSVVAGNVVLANGSHGIQVDQFGFGITITGNQTVANGGLGIDLDAGTEDAFGITANDTDDPDTLSNRLQNFPMLTSASRSAANGLTTVTGSLNSNPSTEFKIDLYMAVADPSGSGEGQLLVATKNITTDAGGDKTFVIFTAALAPGMVLTATATQVVDGSTSEFSANRIVASGP